MRIPIADRRDGTIRARRSFDVDQFRNAPHVSRRPPAPPVDAKAPLIGAFILGFAFGAFFDGILLHQVLQWHHLLSLVQGDLYRDIRVQILADGLFHAAAYLLAAGGLVLLWRGARPPDRIVLGWAVLGFAAWQFADVTLVHWAMGLHRVRIDVPNPLLWDVGWLVVLGTLPLIASFWLLRGQTRTTNRRSPRTSLSIAIMLAGVLSAIPLGDAATAVIFRNGMAAAETFPAVATAGGRVIWSAPGGDMMIIDLPTSSRSELYTRGALLVTSAAWLGCFAPGRFAAEGRPKNS
ncbi:DUF2243 domain-containing protein [Bradyrhizobium sp. URHC0002]